MSKIDASPTKEFFISILGRDITLLDAVKDLVDNSVDGARRTRPSGDFSGLWVQVEVTPEHFLIVDNCGGITVDTAKYYAFRFGRPPEARAQEGSIGQFGVGMKRALFKMGSAFEIQSKAPDSHFKLSVDVENWKMLKDEQNRELWEFEFDEVGECESNPIEKCGTTLQVTELHPAIAVEFASETFLAKLASGLQEAHARSMDCGLRIKVGDTDLHHRMAGLLASNELKPIKIQQDFPANPDDGVPSAVKMTIYAGVSESNANDAGWYIICNGRQIVQADKTTLTGWATVLGEMTTPKAHNQFARFRGYVIFESNDANVLPWNTSKSGVDVESRVYQWALREMVPALRQVIDFLNALDGEHDTGSTHLREVLSRAIATRLSSVIDSNAFVYPSGESLTPPPQNVRVQFDRSVEDVNFAKTHFNVPSAKRAGEEVFNYFMNREKE